MAGTYTITVTSAGSGCSSTSTTAVTVDTLGVTASNSSYACSGGSVNLNSGGYSTAPGTTYSWSGPLGYTSATSNPVLNPVNTAMAGTYTVTVSSTGSGCSSTSTTAVIVDTIAVAPTNSSYACSGGSVNLYSGETGTAPSVTYSWSGPLGYTSASSNPVLNPVNTAMAGTYTITVTSAGSGCSSTSTTAVTVDTLGVTASNNSFACSGGTVDLYSGGYSTAPGTTYSWSGPLGYASATSNPVLSPVNTAMTGTYTVTVSSTGSGCSSTSTTAVTVDTLGVTATNSSVACAGGVVDLYSGGYSTALGTTYSWSGPLGYASATSNPVLSPVNTAMTGTYTVTVSSTGSGCSSTSTTAVTVDTLGVTASNNSFACSGGTVDLYSGGYSSASGTTYSWSGPLGYTSASSNPVLSPVNTAMAGTYTVTVSSTGSGCSSTSTTVVTVDTLGVTATNNSYACSGGTVDLYSGGYSTAPGTIYSWSGPLGYTSATSNPVLSPVNTAMTGTYTVTVSSTGSGCSSTSTTAVSVDTLGVTATNNSFACSGGTVDMYSGGYSTAPGTTYSWSGPLGYTSASSNPILSSVNTAMTGTYTVTVASTGSGCSSTSTTAVTVDTLGVTATNNSFACSGGTVDMYSGGYSTAPGTTYSWSGPLGYTSATSNPVLSPVNTAMTGTYTVTVSSTGSGCSSTSTTAVTVDTLGVTATNTSIACSGGSVNLYAGGYSSAPGTTYSWSGPLGYNSAIANPVLSSVNTAMTGTYTVTIASTGSGCSSTSTTAVTVDTLGVTATNSSFACSGGTVDLYSGGYSTAPGTNYVWHGPLGYTSITSNPVLSPVNTAMTGTYTVTVSSAGSGCSSTSTTAVTVDTLGVTASNNSYACSGGTVDMYSGGYSTAPGTTYSWSGPLGYTSATSNPVLSPVNTAMTGAYTVTVSSAGSGCSSTSTTAVTVDTIAVAPTNSSFACTGGTVDMYSGEYSTAPSVSYSWSGPLGYTSATSNPVLSSVHESMSGVYTVTASSAGSGCTATGTTTVIVDTFNILVSNNSPACVGTSFSIASTYIGTITPTYAWSGPLGFSSASGSTVVTDSAVLGMAGVYTLNISASGSGCSVTKTTIVTVNPIPVGIDGVLSVCVGSTQSLSDATGSGTWSSTAIGIATINSGGIVTGVTPGTSTIFYTLGTGCTTYTVVSVDPVPSVITGTKSVCISSITTLSDAAPGGSWASGNSNASVDGSGNVTGLSAGTVIISYVFPGGCYATTEVTVNSLPAVIFGSTQACTGSTTTLSDGTPGGTWMSSNTSVATIGSSGPTVTLSGLTAGITQITYTSSTGCSRVSSVTINPITAILGVPATVCVGGTITLSDTTAGGTWSSSTVAKGTVNASTGTVYGVASGTTTITYLTSLGCSTNTVVTINPIASIAGTAVVCQGATTSLSDGTTGGTWSSTNTAVATVGTSGIVTAGSTAGTSTISYIVSTTGCMTGVTVTVNPITAILGIPASVCVGSTITLSDATSGGTWSSSLVSKGTVGSSTGTVYGVASGTTTITYQVVATGCMSTSVVTINPISAILGSTTMCSASTITLSDATAGGSWTSGNTSAATIGATGSPVTVSGVSPGGITTITYTTAAGCSSSIMLTVNQTPVLTGTNSVCIGLVTNLTDNTGSGGTWSVNNTNATIDGSGDVTGVFAGTTTVSYTSITGCKTNEVVTINANPGAIHGGGSLCAVSSLTLSDVTTGGTWSSSSSSVSVSGSVISGVSPGTATITYDLATGCIATTIITVDAIPSAISGITTMCAGGTLSLSDGVSGGTWSSGNTAIATIGSASGVLTGVAGGSANITYTTAPGTGCIVSATVTVQTLMPIVGNPYLCQGGTDTLSLSDGTTGGTWSSTSSTIALGTNGVLTALSEGTATVTYTILSGCARTITVTINPAPSAIAGTLLICAGNTTTLSDDGSGTWSIFGNSATVAEYTGVVTASTSIYGTSTVTYTGGAGAGCTATAIVTVVAGPAGIVGPVTECQGTTVGLSDAAASGGTWSSSGDVSVVGAGSTAILTAGSSAGTGTVTYTTPSGCYVTLTNTVKPNPTPIFGNTIVCIGGTTVLSDSTATVSSWTTSNTAIATNAGNNIRGVSAGSVTVTYTITSGCSVTTTVTVETPPVISGNPGPICSGIPYTLTGGVGTWSSSNTTIVTVGSDGTIQGVTGGTAVITYMPSGTSGCSATTVVTVISVSAITGTKSLCANATITLSDITSGGTWSSSNTSIANIGTNGVVSGVYPSSGTATITYTAPSTCIVTATVTVNAAPALITANTSFCAGSSASLSDNTTGGSWSGTGDATVSGSGSLGTIVAGASSGTAMITYTALGCSVTSVVTINTQPQAILGSETVCTGMETMLSDVTSGGSWSSSNTSVATVGTNGAVSGLLPGTATISYTELVGGCNVSVIVTANQSPSILYGPTGVCAGSTITLTDGVSGGSWSASNALVSIDGSGDVTAATGESGTVVITYTLSGGCYSTATITITNIPSAISGSTTVCAGLSIDLTNTTSGGIWTSSNTAIVAVGSTNGIALGNTAGTSSITYSVGPGCITSEVVTVYPLPQAITGNTLFCAGTSSALVDTGSGTWGAASSYVTVASSTGVVTASGSLYGTATVTYTAAVTGCIATYVVSVVPNPTGIVGAVTECPGAVVTVSDAAAGGTWSGSGDVTVVGAGSSASVTAGSAAGTGTITYTLPSGCAVMLVNTVKSNPTPIFGNTTVCIGGTTVLSDSTATVSSWTSNNTAIATNAGNNITGVSAGSITVTYTITTGCSVTTNVTVVNQPVISGNPGAVCPGASFTLTAGAGAWSSSNTAVAAVGTGGSVTGVSGGTATITYMPSGASGCTATTVVTINAAPAITGSGTVCTASTTALTDASVSGTWSSGSTTTATVGTSGIVTGVSTGNVVITYTTASGCNVTATLTVNQSPSAIGGPTNSVCVGNTIILTDVTGGGVWSSSSSAASVYGAGDVTGESAGTVVVSYTAAGCSVTSTVTVNATPGNINGVLSVCSGTYTILSDATAGGVWSITGGTATIGSTGTVTGGASSGLATVSYTISSTGCAAGAVVTVNASAGAITGNSPVCIGASITLVDGGGTWSSSNTAIATIGSATGTLTGEAAGIVNITYYSGGCTVSTIATVSAAVGAINGLASVCQGATLSLSDATAGGAWTSSNSLIATVGTGGSVTGVITGATSAATATITYTTGAGCATSKTITVNPAPATINGSMSLCPSGTTTLTDATTGGTWSITGSDATIVGSTGVVTASASLTGTATITYTAGGCTTKTVITVNANPTGIGGVVSECAGKTVTMTDATAGGSWSSTGSATASGTGTAGTIVAGATAGTASVTYTIISTGCYVKATNTVYNNPAPIVGTFTACTGVTDDLTDATAGGAWSSSNTAVATVAGYYLTGHAQGTTTITYQVTTGSCYVTQVVSVNLTPTVNAISGPATISHAGGAVTLSDATAGGTWNSSNSAIIELIAGTSTPTVTAEALVTTGTVTISYTVTNDWCSTTVTKSVGAATAPHPGGGTVSTTTLYAGTAVSLGGEVSGIWNSSDNTIATVDGSGLVTGLEPGSVIITHQTTDDEGSVTTTVTNVVVTAAPASISLVPNPNKGTFVVKGTVGSVSDQVVTLEVTDVLGQVIYKGTTTAFGGKLNETITLSSNLANGMYLLNVQSGTENKTIHFVIEQ